MEKWQLTGLWRSIQSLVLESTNCPLMKFLVVATHLSWLWHLKVARLWDRSLAWFACLGNILQWNNCDMTGVISMKQMMTQRKCIENPVKKKCEEETRRDQNGEENTCVRKRSEKKKLLSREWFFRTEASVLDVRVTVICRSWRSSRLSSTVFPYFSLGRRQSCKVAMIIAEMKYRCLHIRAKESSLQESVVRPSRSRFIDDDGFDVLLVSNWLFYYPSAKRRNEEILS